MTRLIMSLRSDGSKATVILDGKFYNISLKEGQAGELKRFYNLSQSVSPLSFIYETAISNIKDIIDPKAVAFAQIENSTIYENTNGRLTLNKTTVEVPIELENEFRERMKKGESVTPLLRFWMWCLTNPNETARNGFYKYCSKYGVVIDDAGYALLYKAVNSNKEDIFDSSLAGYVAKTAVNLIKSGRPLSDYSIYSFESGSTKLFYVLPSDRTAPEDYTFVGNVEDLFHKLGRMKTSPFSDIHTGQMQIFLGNPVSMDRSECDPDINRECSYGLHVGSYEYVSAFGNMGSTILLSRVNPRDVVALPQYDNSKIRVCQYTPVGIMERDANGAWSKIDNYTTVNVTSFLHDDEQEYEELEEATMIGDIETIDEGYDDNEEEEEDGFCGQEPDRVGGFYDIWGHWIEDGNFDGNHWVEDGNFDHKD